MLHNPAALPCGTKWFQLLKSNWFSTGARAAHSCTQENLSMNTKSTARKEVKNLSKLHRESRNRFSSCKWIKSKGLKLTPAEPGIIFKSRDENKMRSTARSWSENPSASARAESHNWDFKPFSRWTLVSQQCAWTTRTCTFPHHYLTSSYQFGAA